MEYEKKYKESVEKLREHFQPTTKGLSVGGISKRQLEEIFPELMNDDDTESTDAKIIDEIKFAVMQIPSYREDTRQVCLNWLEEQKEKIGLNAKKVE